MHRTREHQITKIEGRHRTHRANEIGKNYLLETYLNGLNDVDDDDEDDIDGDEEDGNRNDNENKNDNGVNDDHGGEIDKEITTPPNSDSGVNTEDIATSPEIGLSSPSPNAANSSSSSSPIIDTNNNNNGRSGSIINSNEMRSTSNDACKRQSIKDKPSKKQSPRKSHTITMSREAKLMKEHEHRKEFCKKLQIESKSNSLGVSDITTTTTTATSINDKRDLNDHLAGQIELLEKVIAINKHIQHEEELMVRLNAKIRKYEVDDPNLGAEEMKQVLEQINTNIESSSTELKKTEDELNESNQILLDKSEMIAQLSMELEALELSESSENQNVIHIPSHQIQIHNDNRESNENDNQKLELQQKQQQLHREQHVQKQDLPMPPQPSISLHNASVQSNAIKTGTLPKLVPSTLTKNPQINAINTYSGTIPKIQQQYQLPPSLPSSSLPPAQQQRHNRDIMNSAASMASHRQAAVSIPSSAIYVAKNQSFIIPDHVVLSQAPLFFQKSDFNGSIMQSTDQRNLNINYNHPNNVNHNNFIINNNNSNNHSNSINVNNVNFNPSMENAKIGPKKMINGFYKDPDSDTGLSSMGDDGFQQLGTLV